ncbi:MAG: discoidin domain-containing protein [Treponema sp.]|nr:discoidin domain-containing protein [Treponema sp.]
MSKLNLGAALIGSCAMLAGGFFMSCSESSIEEAVATTSRSAENVIYASKFDDLANSRVHANVKGYASSNLRNGSTVPVSVGNLTDGATSVTSYIIANTTDSSAPDINPWFAVDLASAQRVNKVRVVPGAGQDSEGDKNYQNAYPTKYEVQYAEEAEDIEDPADLNALTWKTVAAVEDGTLSARNISFEAVTARYVRILVSEYYDEYCALLELSVFAPDTSTTLESLGDEINVLFIGNSLTYYNNMWSIFEGLSLSRGHHVNATAVTYGGRTLNQHASAQNTEAALKGGTFDYVIIQDKSSKWVNDDTFGDGVQRLEQGAAAIVPKIKELQPNAKILFYGIWPNKSESAHTREVTAAYLKEAKKYDTLFAPAGEAFYDLIQQREYDYYESDGIHPEPVGSFLSASSIYYAVFADEKPISQLTVSRYNMLNTLINSYVAVSTKGIKERYYTDVLTLIDELAYKYTSEARTALAKAESENDIDYISVVDR